MPVWIANLQDFEHALINSNRRLWRRRLSAVVNKDIVKPRVESAKCNVAKQHVFLRFSSFNEILSQFHATSNTYRHSVTFSRLLIEFRFCILDFSFNEMYANRVKDQSKLDFFTIVYWNIIGQTHKESLWRSFNIQE